MGQRRGGTFALVVGILFAAAGCDTRTTSVRVADPGKVSISSGSAIALPSAGASSGEQRGTLRDDSFETEPGARSHYKIQAVRQNGEVALEWTAKVPILNGEHQTLIDRTGTFNDPNSVVALISPDALRRETFRIDACANLYPVSAKGASLVGYRVTEWNPCSGSPYQGSGIEAPFTVQTPWTNVVEIRDHIEVSVPGDIAIGILGLGTAGGGVALIAVPKDCIGCAIGGGAMALIGALTMLTAALDIGQGSFDIIRYPPKSSAH